MNVLRGSTFPWGIYSEVHSPITTPEIICVMVLTLEPIRGCPRHSGETGTQNIVSNSQTSPLLIFPEGVGMYVHRLKPQMWLPCRSVKSQNRPFYRYSGHIELIRFREYYRMPRGHEHISFVFSSAFQDIFS